MSKNRKIGIIIWILSFALSVLLLFIIPNTFTNGICATLVFDCIAFISTLSLWLSLFRNASTPSEVFYCSQAMTVSTIYIVVQFIICIVVAVFSEVIPFKLVLISNLVLSIVAWIIILSTITARDHTRRIDSRQKNHHVEL